MSESIGTQLRKAREDRGISLGEVAQATRIRIMYLQALEDDNYAGLPSPVQGRGFLRNYAEYLGVPAQPLLEAWPGRPAPVVLPPASSPSLPMDRKSRPVHALPPAVEEGRGKSDRPVQNIAGDEFRPPEAVHAANQPQPQEGIDPAATLFELDDGDGSAETYPSHIDRPSTTGDASPGDQPWEVRTRGEEIQGDVLQETQPQQEEPVSGSQAVLTAIGVTLRNQRELLSLSLTDIEKYTHLRLHYLKALEGGRLDDLPSPTQGRGMLNNYARFLNLDADRLLNQFADALIARREEKLGPGVPGQPGAQPRSAPKTPSRPGLFRFVSMDLLVGSSLILALIGVVVWTASQVMAVSSEPGGEPTAPSIADVLLASPEITSSLDLEAVETQAGVQPTAGFPAGFTGVETATPTPDGGLVSGGLPPLQEGEFQLSVIAMQRVWLKVVVDGEVEFMGRTKPGSVYTYPADERIELTTGNAAGIQIVYNQESLGPLGNWSEVVHTVYTVDGVFAPTATATATPTRTPRVTITPTPTETLQPSITPRSTIPAP